MALGYTLVDYTALTQAVSELKDIKTDLTNKLTEANTEMQRSLNTRDIYLSSEARTCQQEFERMYNKWSKEFDKYVQEYVDFFETVKKEYKITGDNIDSLAKQVNNKFID